VKATSGGRLLFGATAVLFAIIALLWHDAATWQGLAALWRLPAGTEAGQALMGLQIAGGVGLLYRRAARSASVALGVVYGVFALTCLAGVVENPRAFDAYDGLFEQVALLCGAIAAYAMAHGHRSAPLVRYAAFGMGLSAVSFAIAQIVYFRFTAGLVPKWIPPNGVFWAIVTTIAFFAAACGLITGYRSRSASLWMAAMVASFGVLVWIPILMRRPQSHGSWSELSLTLLIAGAAWTLGEILPRTESARLIGGAYSR
jgi:hypothetical protein